MANELSSVINQIRRELTEVGSNFFSFRNAAKQNDDKLFNITKDAYSAIRNNKKIIEDVQTNFSDIRNKHNEIREKTFSVERNLNEVIANQRNITKRVDETNRAFTNFRRNVLTNFSNMNAIINDVVISNRRQQQQIQPQPVQFEIPKSAYQKEDAYRRSLLDRMLDYGIYRGFRAPGAMPSAVPGAVSGAVPGAVSGVSPGAVSGAVPGAIRGITPTPTPTSGAPVGRPPVTSTPPSSTAGRIPSSGTPSKPPSSDSDFQGRTKTIVSRSGKIDEQSFFESAVAKVRKSKLNGFVPRDGARYGIVTGSPEEWARLYTMILKQESGGRIARVGPDGRLIKFRSTPSGEKSYGPLQFNKGEYGLKTWSEVNDPDRNIDALIKVGERWSLRSGVISGRGRGSGYSAGWGGYSAYFGSLRRPRETLQHRRWFEKNIKMKPEPKGKPSEEPQQQPQTNIRPVIGGFANPEDVPTSGGSPGSREFGRSFNGYPIRGGRGHAGLDVPLKLGQKVKGDMSGKILKIGYDRSGYGHYIDIQYDNGVIVRSSHHSAIGKNLKEGDRVTKDTIIAYGGYSGNAGRNFPHDHREVWAPKTINGREYSSLRLYQLSNRAGGSRAGMHYRTDPRQYYKQLYKEAIASKKERTQTTQVKGTSFTAPGSVSAQPIGDLKPTTIETFNRMSFGNANIDMGGFDIASNEANNDMSGKLWKGFGKSVPTSRERREIFQKGGIVVNTDTNFGPRNQQTGPEVIIPDNATEEQKKYAEAYVKQIEDAYRAKFGKSIKGRVLTHSENKARQPNRPNFSGGRTSTIHTEPFSVMDDEAVKYFTQTKEGRKILADITKDTLGQISGVVFSEPHNAYKRRPDTGAENRHLGVNEVTLSKTLLEDMFNSNKSTRGLKEIGNALLDKKYDSMASIGSLLANPSKQNMDILKEMINDPKSASAWKKEINILKQFAPELFSNGKFDPSNIPVTVSSVKEGATKLAPQRAKTAGLFLFSNDPGEMKFGDIELSSSNKIQKGPGMPGFDPTKIVPKEETPNIAVPGIVVGKAPEGVQNRPIEPTTTSKENKEENVPPQQTPPRFRTIRPRIPVYISPDIRGRVTPRGATTDRVTGSTDDSSPGYPQWAKEALRIDPQYQDN